MSGTLTPRVSVLIPIYNVEAYIEECLRSVLKQDYSNLEIILVDDCSPDNSLVIAEKVIEENPKGHTIQVIKHTENKGAVGARITAIMPRILLPVEAAAAVALRQPKTVTPEKAFIPDIRGV